MLCAFWLGHVLRATTACNFSSLIWPAGSAPAALVSLLFDPPEPQIIGKTQCLATFLPFRAPGYSFFWDFLFLIFFLLLSSSLLFSDSSHLCFSSVHIVESLTSKLPSMRTPSQALIISNIVIWCYLGTLVHWPFRIPSSLVNPSRRSPPPRGLSTSDMEAQDWPLPIALQLRDLGAGRHGRNGRISEVSPPQSDFLLMLIAGRPKKWETRF